MNRIVSKNNSKIINRLVFILVLFVCTFIPLINVKATS